ncbi:MAG: hypothetical protein WKG06_31200 [Segetibacter sp.]
MQIDREAFDRGRLIAKRGGKAFEKIVSPRLQKLCLDPNHDALIYIPLVTMQPHLLLWL